MIYLSPDTERCINKIEISESSSVGRAQPCQGWGREFESRLPLNTCRSGGMVDTLVLGTNVLVREGSSPSFGTKIGLLSSAGQSASLVMRMSWVRIPQEAQRVRDTHSLRIKT